MIAGGAHNGLLLLAGLGLLAGCAFEVPSFLGREGGGDGTYQLGGEERPEPRQVPLRQAEAERALHGLILRVEGEARPQGYHTAELRPVGEADAAGILGFELVATPPSEVTPVGPARTRQLSAAVFLPNPVLEDLRGFRVAGGGTVRTLTLR